jgi:hypothetical protein
VLSALVTATIQVPAVVYESVEPFTAQPTVVLPGSNPYEYELGPDPPEPVKVMFLLLELYEALKEDKLTAD